MVKSLTSLSEISSTVFGKKFINVAIFSQWVKPGFLFPFFSVVGAATNRRNVTTLNTARLDRETEELKHEKIPQDVGKIIMQGRQAKNWTQKDLATVSNK